MAFRIRTDPIPRDHARRLRSEMTDAERRLWSRLRRRQIEGLHFRKQVPIGNYIVDFCCLKRRLIVEVDGSQHAEREEQDAERTAWLSQQGYRVLRFWNNEVLQNTDGVMERILRAVTREG
ncbi:endonuclease domain-containing protein [Dongia sp.]|uniref:endonuclease domain-containing protein n=1 Tax=Dongia sp. TaxID=1977262 RepID=UPI0037501C0C